MRDLEVQLMNKKFRNMISTDYAARVLAEDNGLSWFRIGTKVFIETEQCIAEVYWMNRKHTMMGIREAACPVA